MSSTAAVTYTHSHTVTYLAGKLLHSIKKIIHQSGLDPSKLADGWESYERAIKTWLSSGHLQAVTIEVYRPSSNALVRRWDLTVEYATAEDGFWFDPDDIYYEIRKCGLWPSTCEYSIIVHNKPGRPHVDGWGPTTFRPTDGLVRQSIGTMISANGIRASAAHWVKV